MFFVILIFGAALFIDGATDAANSVTGAVSSKTMTLRGSTVLSSLLSFSGCVISCIFFPSVMENSASVVVFPENCAEVGVISSLLSVALWSGLAWLFSLPTSEGHALIAAGAGAALALGGCVSWWSLLFVILSIIPSALLSAVLSVLFSRLLQRKKEGSFRVPIIASAAISSFFHGSQDGQKFLALALSATLISEKERPVAAVLAASFMAVGTLFGGRIIRKMGGEMARANSLAAISSDLGSALALSLLTYLGVPASTTHVKMISLGAATKAAGGKTDRGTFILLILAWVATFPVSFALSFLLSKVFFLIFL